MKSNLNNTFQSLIICDNMSDHYPCLLSIPTNEQTYDKIIEVRKLSEETITKINQKLLFTDWSLIYEMDVNDGTSFLIDQITDALNEFAPKHTKKVVNKQIIHEPWMTVRLLKYNNKSRKLCMKAKTTGKYEDFERYKNYCITLNHLKLSEKRSFYDSLFKKIGKNSKMLWEVLNRLTKKLTNKTEITSVLTDGCKVHDPKCISNVLNEHFVNVGKKTQHSIKNCWRPIRGSP